MRALVFLIGLVCFMSAATAAELKTYMVKGAFDEVAFDVESTIVDRGLVIDMKGDVGGMLQRTGKDVGAGKEIYVGAKYFTFCSAVLSRKMMEADAATMGFCPYSIFVYETKAKPGEVVVGYRRTTGGDSKAAGAALSEVDTWLDGIVREAAGK
jgi:uncharacterized protein (DUF302 family)